MLADFLPENALLDFSIWVIMAGGSGVIAYWAMEQLKKIEGWELSAMGNRVVALTMAALLAMGLYGFGMWLGFWPVPETAQQWVIVLFAAAAPSLGVSQLVHGAKKL
jgi:hypothetical protein